MVHLLLVVIYIAFISLGLPDALLGSAWPMMHQEFSVPVSYAGLISMIIAASTVLSSLQSDRLTKRFGTEKVMVVSVAMTAAALGGFSVSSSYWMLCLLAVPYGLGAGSVDAALNNYVALHYASWHMSWLHCMWGVGASIGPFIMEYALTGGGGWQGGYRAIMVLQIILTFILTLSLPLWKRAFPDKPDLAADEGETAIDTAAGALNGEMEVSADQSKEVLSLRQVFAIRGAREVMLMFFCYCALEQTAGLWASSYLTLGRGIAPETAAGLAGLFFYGITAGRAVSGFLTIVLSDRMMIRMGQLVIAAGIVLSFLPFGDFITFAGLILIGLGCAPIYPCIIHSTPAYFGKDRSQAVIGVQMACAYVGTCMMPPLFGLIAEHISIHAFPLYLALLLILMFWMHERLLAKMQKAQQEPVSDLHIHSCYSDDGEFTPAQLVKMCKAAGITQMAVADHNTVRGCKEALKAAKAEGITCIPAIEIDCVFEGSDFHLLGYGIDIESKDFAQIEAHVRAQREQASAQMFRKTQEMGFLVSEEELRQLSAGSYWSGCWSGEMFAEILLGREEYQEHPLLLPYRSGGARSDNPYVNFYWDYYSCGKPCYVKLEYPTMQSMIRLIHQNGGIAVLAHPGVNLKGREQELEHIARLGLDGVEAYSSYHTDEQSRYFAGEAERLGLRITRGSDFHGKTKPSVYLGQTF